MSASHARMWENVGEEEVIWKEEQRAVEGDVVVTSIFFNYYNSIYHDRIDIQGAAR